MIKDNDALHTSLLNSKLKQLQPTTPAELVVRELRFFVIELTHLALPYKVNNKETQPQVFVYERNAYFQYIKAQVERCA